MAKKILVCLCLSMLLSSCNAISKVDDDNIWNGSSAQKSKSEDPVDNN